MGCKMLRAALLVLPGMMCAVTGCTGSANGPKALHGNSQVASSSYSAPSAARKVCGQPILRSPWSYAGDPGTFSAKNDAKGLPTIDTAKSDFPGATEIIVVAPGNNTASASSGKFQVNRAVVYFEPGIHYIEQGMYTGHNTAYVGGYSVSKGGAILDGVDGATNGTGKGGSVLAGSKASSGNRVYDTWEYLQIENYSSTENNAVMGNVNDGGSDIGDTYKFDTIGPNNYGYVGNDARPRQGESSGGGYAIDAGSNTTIEFSCLTGNAQGGFNISDARNVNILHNEISWNGLGEYPDLTGTGGSPFSCGCSGGGKLFFTLNANIIENYVHDNYNTGIWFDFDNAGANVTANYIASNWGSGITYEASYNARIAHNTLIGNGWASNHSWPAGVNGGKCFGGISCVNGVGPITGAGGGNPYAAIDLSNSGGNRNLHSRYAGQLQVVDNRLENNFGGVKVYTDTNRYPGNVDNDSACSIPLGVLNQNNSQLYYKQGKELVTGPDAAITGSSVQSAGGTMAICAKYGSSSDFGPGTASQAPSIGMGVFDQHTGAFLGTVAAVSNAHSFTLSDAPGNSTGATLLLSAYGGCGPADYYRGGLNKMSGRPAAKYWDNCLWGSRNITVQGNVFSINAKVVLGCKIARNLCGTMEVAAFNAGVPKLMQFFDSYPQYIADSTGGLGVVWSHNNYEWTGGGSGWHFWAGTQGHEVTRAKWQAKPYNQDTGSVFKG